MVDVPTEATVAPVLPADVAADFTDGGWLVNDGFVIIYFFIFNTFSSTPYSVYSRIGRASGISQHCVAAPQRPPV